MSIMNAMNMTISSMRDMQSTMGTDMDTSSLDAATQAANQAQAAMEALNQSMHTGGQSPGTGGSEPTPTPSTDPVQVPVEWVTNDLDVFSNSGIDRFEQEVTATNQMLTTLSDRQNQIAQNAAGTDIFSDSAMQDINSMGQRIQAVQQRIQQIENNPVNLGTDTANAELEELRSQLNQAQAAMDDGFDTGSIVAAENAMQQMESQMEEVQNRIQKAGKGIDDNVNKQENFTRTVQESNSAFSSLSKTIMGLAIVQNVIGMVQNQVGSALERMDILNNYPKVMSNLGISADDANASIQVLSEKLKGIPTTLQDAASSVQRFTSANNNIQRSTMMFLALNNAILAGGADTMTQKSALEQLSQSYAKGKPDMMEWRSAMTAMPAQLNQVAEAMGYISADALGESLRTGNESMDEFMNTLIQLNETGINGFPSFEEQARNATGGFITSIQNMKSAVTRGITSIVDSINQGLNEAGFGSIQEQIVSFGVTIESVLGRIGMVVGNMIVMIAPFVDMIVMIATCIIDNWSVIEPIILGIVAALALHAAALAVTNTLMGISATISAAKAAADALAAGATFLWTVQQYGLNAALMACPLTWIILLIIAVIAAIFAVCNAIAKMTGVANSGFGVITGGINVVIQFFKNLGLSVANIALGIGNAIAALASNMMTAFHNAICNVQSWFYNLLSTALTVIEGICVALNKLPFVEFDYSGISSAADDYASKAAEAAGNKEDYKSIGDAFNTGMSTFDTFQSGWASEAFSAGASWGDGVADKVSGMFSMDNIDPDGGVDTSMLSNDFANNAAQTAANTADTANSAGRIADSVDVSNENLKWMRDIAETEAINRFTTAEIVVNQNNNNNISSDMDIDGMVDHLSAGLLEAMEMAAEGVH